MSFCQLHWNSQILRKQTTTWVLLPDVGTPPFAVFYLLHGLSDDQTMWMRRTRIEMYAARWPMIIVMPDGGRGFYTNHAAGPQWATHIAEELPAMIERTFPAKTARDGRCIGGLSMGGYGALRVALGYPDRFVSANSHSGALLGPSLPRGVISMDEYHQMFGPAYEGSEHDLTVLAKRAKDNRATLPRLLIDCGRDDHLLEANRKIHRELSALQVEHEYNDELPGGHDWNYWDSRVSTAIAFHAKQMGLQPLV
jgi:S-formylglutathione hydrolase FrmB